MTIWTAWYRNSRVPSCAPIRTTSRAPAGETAFEQVAGCVVAAGEIRNGGKKRDRLRCCHGGAPWSSAKPDAFFSYLQA